ncbi:MAG: hypothetical protein ABW298_04305 [Candidatus Binatia bacterium]|jgi:hypothetical protein
MKRIAERANALLRRLPTANQRGQTFMEYILLVIVSVLVLRFFSVLFQIAIRHYLGPIYFWVSLPFP